MAPTKTRRRLFTRNRSRPAEPEQTRHSMFRPNQVPQPIIISHSHSPFPPPSQPVPHPDQNQHKEKPLPHPFNQPHRGTTYYSSTELEHSTVPTAPRALPGGQTGLGAGAGLSRVEEESAVGLGGLREGSCTPSARAKVLPWVQDVLQTRPSESEGVRSVSSSRHAMGERERDGHGEEGFSDTGTGTGTGTGRMSTAHAHAHPHAEPTHLPLSAAELARADSSGRVRGLAFVPPPPLEAVGRGPTWVREEERGVERMRRGYENEDRVGDGTEAGDGTGTEARDGTGSGTASASESDESLGKEVRERRRGRHREKERKRAKQREREKETKKGKSHAHRDKTKTESRSKSKSVKRSEERKHAEPNRTDLPTAGPEHAPPLPALTRPAMEEQPQQEGLGMSGMNPTPAFPWGQSQFHPQPFFRPGSQPAIPVTVGEQVGLDVPTQTWVPASASLGHDHHETATPTAEPQTRPQPRVPRGSAQDYFDGAFHPVLAPAPTSATRREYEQANDRVRVEDLQRQMLRSAEDSRLAIAREREDREREDREREDREREEKRFPIQATYIHTNVGDIKTFENIKRMTESTRASSEADRSERTEKRSMREGKRKTKETLMTDTSGPSFGHLGRPFSYRLDHRNEPVLMSESDDLAGLGMEETDMISPLGGGGPVLIMHRVMGGTDGLTPGLSGLHLGEVLGRSGQMKDHRSAYVETVVDEEDLRSPRTKGTLSANRTRQAESSHRSSVTGSPEVISPPKQTRPDIQGSVSSMQGSFVQEKQPLPSATDTPPGSVPRLRPPLVTNDPNKRMSTATTTMSLVNQIVSDSRFHDDALCDLLRAARDVNLGTAANKALRRAARERVMDLTGMRTRYPARAESEATVTAVPAHRSGKGSVENDDEPPAWSRALFDMLEQTNARLDALDDRMGGDGSHAPTDSLAPAGDEEELAARAALHNLLFPNLPMEIPLFGSGPYATPPRSQFQTPSRARDISAPQTAGQMPDWGSSVEIPDGSSVPIAPIHPLGHPVQPMPPTIHVQPPTAAQSIAEAASRKAPSEDKRTPEPETHMREYPAASTIPPAPTIRRFEDPLLPDLPYPRPWDIVTQRLFSWALVWPPEDFVRSLEQTALGQQVDEFGLTIYTMTLFKRNLRHRMSSVPPLPCDKLFVPPNLADSINRAVHAKRFSDAQQILEELWYPFGFKEPPRVIIALAKHRNDGHHWSAHRFDMPTGRLVTFSFSTEEKSLVDGRPFMWWFALRAAWPNWGIPHPDHLAQKTQRIITSASSQKDNALMAANCSRNLLLGWKPEQHTDLKKMRNNVWNETKRLYERKSKGKLVIDSKDY